VKILILVYTKADALTNKMKEPQMIAIEKKADIIRLPMYGISTPIENFLSGRRQYVMVNSKLSTWAGILSGIPQGSVFWANSVRHVY